MRKYTLIVNGPSSFSLSNETDADVMTDYFPGIWGITTQKNVLKYAKEYLANGDEIRVTDYDNPKYHAIANKFITELGLKQPLFQELSPAPTSTVTNGKPSTLGSLKKFLQVGTKIKIVSTTYPDRTRDTEVIQTKNESVVTRKGTGQSHLYFDKAMNWGFDNSGATYYSLDRDGKWSPSFKIEYLSA